MLPKKLYRAVLDDDVKLKWRERRSKTFHRLSEATEFVTRPESTYFDTRLQRHVYSSAIMGRVYVTETSWQEVNLSE